jgi:hypothetical protein
MLNVANHKATVIEKRVKAHWAPVVAKLRADEPLEDWERIAVAEALEHAA